MPQRNWEGEERRKNGGRDHDLLIRIEQNLFNFLNAFEAHIKSDDIYFVEQNKRLKSLERYCWLGIGGLGVLQVVITIYLAIKF